MADRTKKTHWENEADSTGESFANYAYDNGSKEALAVGEVTVEELVKWFETGVRTELERLKEKRRGDD